jgi:hypothetical protein
LKLGFFYNLGNENMSKTVSPHHYNELAVACGRTGIEKLELLI